MGYFRSKCVGISVFIFEVASFVVTSSSLFAQSKAPNDPGYLLGYQADLTLIQGPQAWALNTDCSSMIVAVIDTGVDMNHPDLRANLAVNSDGSIGKSYITGVKTAQDDNGHGTFVSGVIGAIGGNGYGVTGVCWKAKIMPLKVLDSTGSGSTSSIYLAIQDATKMGIRITNNSYGISGGNTFLPSLLRTAVQQAGAAGSLYIKAAGNDHVNIDAMVDMTQSLPNMIVVAASDGANPASFTNYGVKTVDIAAPGVNLVSTYPNQEFAQGSGTSFSSPLVAGAAALVWTHYKTLTADNIKTRLLNQSDSISTLSKTNVGGRRLNLSKAIH